MITITNVNEIEVVTARGFVVFFSVCFKVVEVKRHRQLFHMYSEQKWRWSS